MTVEELQTISEKEKESCRQCPNHLHVCMAAGCLSSQADKVQEALEAEVKAAGLEGKCQVKGVGCGGSWFSSLPALPPRVLARNSRLAGNIQHGFASVTPDR